MLNLFQHLNTPIIADPPPDSAPPIIEKIISEQPIEEHPVLDTQASSASPLLEYPTSPKLLAVSKIKPSNRSFSEADQDLQSPSSTKIYSTLGLSITVLGLILFGAPTSGLNSRLIGFVQSLLGTILVAISF